MLKTVGARLIGLAALAMLAGVPGVAAAQTADTQTPAAETACNSQTGAAYGLCTSYCEAMDCDSTAPAASPMACNKVYDNFQRLTGQAPPCLCPCAAGWATVEQAAKDAGLPVTTCATGEGESQVLYGDGGVRLNLVSYTVEGSYCTGWNNSGTPVVSVSPLTSPQIAACRSVISNICAQQ